MEAGLLAILAVIGAFVVYFLKGKKPLDAKVLQFEKKEAVLKNDQEDLEKDIDDLEKRLDDVTKKAKDLKPGEVENFWNNNGKDDKND